MVLRLYVWFRDLLRREEGQDLIEYALIAVLVSAAIVLATTGILTGAFGNWAGDVRDCISNTQAAGSNCPW